MPWSLILCCVVLYCLHLTSRLTELQTQQIGKLEHISSIVVVRCGCKIVLTDFTLKKYQLTNSHVCQQEDASLSRLSSDSFGIQQIFSVCHSMSDNLSHPFVDHDNLPRPGPKLRSAATASNTTLMNYCHDSAARLNMTKSHGKKCSFNVIYKKMRSDCQL